MAGGTNPGLVGRNGGPLRAATNRGEAVMRKLLFVLVLLVGGVVVLGFYRGWLSFERTHDSANGREGAQIEVDRTKFEQDVEKVKHKVGVGGTAQAGEKPEGR